MCVSTYIIISFRKGPLVVPLLWLITVYVRASLRLHVRVYKLYGLGGRSREDSSHFQKPSNVNENTKQRSPRHPFVCTSQFRIKCLYACFYVIGAKRPWQMYSTCMRIL